ncbi:response regulator transcription factor [Reichenbachiella carrageenanivorans]|uniref:Response regulator transcription factor n=1 Tax=Reichenbachiella carrageenanivorans TaxID=2979869 RepID=A0ABY6CZ54_9BACT|nr:response regulator transcription factor [Reichenbachiella carrageenanivorans]UXX79201.1 response regulator transcription factor [Reichenbachiella carrageenanivorans]
MPESKVVRIVIADDHPLLLQGLKDLLLQRGGIEILGAVSDGAAALKLILDNPPDIALLDIEMPYLSGLSIADECRKKQLETKFILLSYHKEPAFIAQAKSLNIAGYLLKEDTSTEIFKCIDEVMKGNSYYSLSILSTTHTTDSKKTVNLDLLSSSEKKILKLVASQCSSQMIAERLHISARTVEKHRSNIINKLNLAGQSNSLSLWAVEQKAVIMAL